MLYFDKFLDVGVLADLRAHVGRDVRARLRRKERGKITLMCCMWNDTIKG